MPTILTEIERNNELLKLFKNSKRPILIFGWGIHLSNAEKIASDLALSCLSLIHI